MGIIIWLVVGGICGWLASMIMRTDAQQGVILNVVVGIVGALFRGDQAAGGRGQGGSGRWADRSDVLLSRPEPRDEPPLAPIRVHVPRRFRGGELCDRLPPCPTSLQS